MSLKDIFNSEKKKKNNLTTTNFQNLTDLGESVEVESVDFIVESNKELKRFIPPVDYATASNFTKFGLAERYYEESIERITSLYPFDGSLKEKKEWRNNSTPLDLYIFDKEYPKTTGYVNFASGGWGTKSGALSQGYGLPTTVEYISFLNRAVDNKLDNINDPSAKRRENTRFIFSTGSTIEFWLKKNSFANATTQTSKEAIFYTKTYDDAKRLVVFVSGGTNNTSSIYTSYYTLNPPFGVTTEFEIDFDTGLSTIADSTWHHYAITYGSSSAGYSLEFYIDGVYKQTKTSVGPIVNLTGAAVSSLGALKGPLNSISGDLTGYGKLSGSIDEFRFWNVKRTAKQVGRYYITSEIGDGVNTDDANTDLGIHFKFNDGITTDSGIDARVLDYSGRTCDGTFVGYSSTSRSTGSAIDDAGFSEPKDPIIYLNHPDVVSYKETKMDEGRAYDFSNAGNLYKKFPAFMLDEDEEGGFVLRNLTQIMASYLDQLYLQIQFLPKMKQIEYTDEANKPHNFYAKALENAGFPSIDLFEDIEAFNKYLNRSEKQLFESDFQEIKNRIYQNIYNNLPYILKSKGTEKSFRNLIRCFGVDDEIYKLNLYTDNSEYLVKEQYRNSTISKNYINFNQLYNTDAVVYTYPDNTNPNSVGWISGSNSTLESNIANTYEFEVIFPKKADVSDSYFVPFEDTQSSILGIVSVNTSSQTDTTIPTNNLANFEFYAVRPESLSDNVYFVLTSSFSSSVASDNFYLTSSLIKGIYDDQKWNFAIRIKPQGYDIGNLASPSSPTDYTLEVYGVSVVGDYKVDEINLSTTIGTNRGNALLTKARRLYVGSKRTNVTGSTLVRSDTKVSSVKVWYDYLDDDTIYNNAIQGDVDGNESPYKSAYLGQTQLSATFIPKIDTLALNWKFNKVYLSDTNGNFTVIDNSSGSANYGSSKYGQLGNILKQQHTGRGDFFAADTRIISKEYTPVLRKKDIEQLSTEDTISILNNDDLTFTKDTRPIRTYISVERSMYQTISEEMLKLMSSIKSFSNLIGEPQNRYRHEYKEMSKLKSLFFESIGNTPDFEKYVEYYQWLDVSLNRVIENLFPASANFSEEINTMVESHVLERNKHKWKFPTMEFKTPEPQAGLIGVNKHLYNWKYGHAPIPLQQTTSSLWWNKRAERSGPVLSSSNAAVNSNKTDILSVSYQVLNRSYTTPVRYTVDEAKQYVGGTGIKNKKFDYYKPSRSDISVDVTSNVIQPDTTDYSDLNRKYDAQSIYSADGKKFRFLTPFSYYQNQRQITGSTQTITTNHLDVYGPSYEVPMQGPFTEKYVGGNSYRHQQLFSTGSNRAEAYILSGSNTNRVIRNPFNVNVNQARSDFYREELAKRPVNIKNIAQTTGSTIIGNYDKKYQYFQTSNRNVNNLFFTKNNGISSVGRADPYVSGSNTWTLPNRTRTETVFVERFSAPGDAVTMGEGALDVKSAQFSVYNALPFRNLNVRTALKKFLTDPSSHGYVSGSSVTASFHKVPKNSYSNIAGSTNNDNYWIQHPIPQCDLNYSWINEIANSGSTCDNYTFSSASSITNTNGNTLSQSVDYVGLNFYVIDPIYTASNLFDNNTIGSGSLNSYINSTNGYYTLTKEQAFSALMSKRNGGHGFAAWNQIRGGEKPLAKYLRYNNILPVEEKTLLPIPSSLSFDGGIPKFNFSNILVSTTKNYIEPPITVNYPVQYKFKVSNNINGKVVDTVTPFVFSHENNTTYFANQELNDKYVDVNKIPKQLYEKINELIKTDNSPIKEVQEFKYVEKLFPRKVNAYRGIVRGRTEYTETTEQKNQNPIQRRTFWRDSLSDRLRSSVNSQGRTLLVPISVNALEIAADISNNVQYGGELLLPGTYYPALPFLSRTQLTASAAYVSSPNFDYDAFMLDSTIEYLRNNTYQEAQINPWYDTYNDFSKDIRSIAKDYTLIPEFKISDHIPYFISGSDFNFNSKELENFLNIDGASISSSAQQNFYKVYSHTDFINNFANFENDMEDIGIDVLNKTMKVKMSVIKKLLPYNGFYPSARTLQMATLFSSSFSGTTTGGYYVENVAEDFLSGDYDGYPAFFSGFFSPGILYNTIKSGIGVDFPAHTGSKGVGDFEFPTGMIPSADYRLKFESLISPNKTNLPVSQSIGIYSGFGSFASASWNGAKNNSLYELAMNNFLGETIKFFLKEQTTQVHVSAKQSEYKILDKNKTYYMDISVYKSPDDFIMYESTTTHFNTSGKGAAYGSQYYLTNFNNSTSNAFKDPVYASCTPPYFYGKSTVRLSFKPSENRVYAPSEIISGITSSFFNSCNINNGNRLTASADSGSIMRIDASINYKNITTVKEITYNAFGDVSLVTDKPANSGYDVWTISPKMETPIFNYSDKDPDYDRGMWVNYKDNQGNSKEGVFLEISDPFPQKTNTNDPLTGSLIDVCKFDTVNSVKKLGQLADLKEISEAIVAIPITKDNKRYEIPSDTFKLLQNPNLANAAKPLNPKPSKALQDMYERIQNYVFPPHLDFINNKSVKPFGMYIFEFTSTLSKLDLGKIWQGVMPEIATKIELEEQVIEHGFGEGDIFNNKFDPETRWIVFKVKRKAENSYYNSVAGASQDTRFDFQFQIGNEKISAKKSILPYSYNWPYDFFSLVELAKMDAEITYKKK